MVGARTEALAERGLFARGKPAKICGQKKLPLSSRVVSTLKNFTLPEPSFCPRAACPHLPRVLKPILCTSSHGRLTAAITHRSRTFFLSSFPLPYTLLPRVLVHSITIPFPPTSSSVLSFLFPVAQNSIIPNWCYF
jgi:hypothetical protein